MPEGGGLRVGYKELGVRDGESPVLSCDLESGPKSTRTLLLDWTDFITAQSQLLGYSYLDTDGALVRYLPQRDWDQPELWANRVNRVKGIGWRAKVEREYGKGSSFAKCAAEVEFAPRPYDVFDKSEIETEFDRYVGYELVSEGDYLSVPVAGVLKWSEGSNAGQAFPGNVGKIVGQGTYTFTWYQVPYSALPFDAIRAALGHVNGVTLENSRDETLSFPPGTLLLLGAGYRIVRMPLKAGWAWNVEYMMKYREEGWSRLFDFKATVPAWYQFSIDGNFYSPAGPPADGKLLYDSADFGDLFSPPQ